MLIIADSTKDNYAIVQKSFPVGLDLQSYKA